MKKAILATKVGMTQIFNENGALVPVTVLQAGPCVVTQVKTAENDGYKAVQVGFVEKFLVAGKRDHSSACFYVFTAECGYFRSENLFESLERFSDECRCG